MTPSRILDRAMASIHSGSCPPRDEHAPPSVPSDTPSAAPERGLIREALREIVRPATIAELIVLFACLIAPALILFVGE